MSYMQTDRARRLIELVGESHAKMYMNNLRFRATIEAAVCGSTDDDVLALLVRGLVEACRDTESMRDELQRVIERWPR